MSFEGSTTSLGFLITLVATFIALKVGEKNLKKKIEEKIERVKPHTNVQKLHLNQYISITNKPKSVKLQWGSD